MFRLPGLRKLEILAQVSNNLAVIGNLSPALRDLGELASAIRDRRISQPGAARRVPAPGRDGQPALNAIVTIGAERALDAAHRADQAGARLAGRPPHGPPVTVKDAIATAGIRSTGGAAELAGNVPSEDPPAIRRLKQATVEVFHGIIAQHVLGLPRPAYPGSKTLVSRKREQAAA
jgi:Amidase